MTDRNDPYWAFSQEAHREAVDEMIKEARDMAKSYGLTDEEVNEAVNKAFNESARKFMNTNFFTQVLPDNEEKAQK